MILMRHYYYALRGYAFLGHYRCGMIMPPPAGPLRWDAIYFRYQLMGMLPCTFDDFFITQAGLFRRRYRRFYARRHGRFDYDADIRHRRHFDAPARRFDATRRTKAAAQQPRRH